MGRFEVQTYEGASTFASLLVEAQSAITLMPSRSLNSVSTAQADKVLHVFIVLNITTHGGTVDIWGLNPPLPPLKPTYANHHAYWCAVMENIGTGSELKSITWFLAAFSEPSSCIGYISIDKFDKPCVYAWFSAVLMIVLWSVYFGIVHMQHGTQMVSPCNVRTNKTYY